MEKLKTKTTKNKAQSIDNQIIRLLSFTFSIQIILSFNLWINTRGFPMTPIISGIELSPPFDFLICIIFIALLLCNTIFKRTNLNTGLVIILFLLIIQDINRLQPWTYIYLIAFILMSINSFLNIEELIKDAFQIIIIGAFFWSGISKLNYHFLEVTYLNILEKVFRIEQLDMFINYQEFGFIIPLIEISVAILLIINKTRNSGVILAISSHLFIIYFVSPLGINNDMIVIPWNLLMIIIVYLVFYNRKIVEGFKWKNVNEKIVKSIVILFVIILPFFNLFDKWDNFLSFNLYSDKIKNLLIVIDDKEISKLDQKLQNRFVNLNGIEGGKVLSLTQWSFQELNTPYYPEKKVLNTIQEYFCQFQLPKESLIFLEFNGKFTSENITRFYCGDER